MKRNSILAISEHKDLLKELRNLMKKDYELITFTNLLDGLDMLRESEFDVVFIDENITGFTFTEIMRKLKVIGKEHMTVALIDRETDNVIDDIKFSGAYDYIVKPLTQKTLDKVMKYALNNLEILREKRELEKKLLTTEEENEVVGQSAPMKNLKKFVDKVAESDVTVLIMGENGSGKELVAKDIYKKSLRRKKPFITLNCAAISTSLIESELFGYEKGSFTGASSAKKGIIEEADGGTLFLDEIGEMDINLQAKLLRVVEYGEVRKVGGNKTSKVDVRFIAATNKNLEEEVKKGKFRRDLYHRLANFPIFVPPLRERKEDIPLLANYFLNKIVTDLHKEMLVISGEAMKYMIEYAFPGNIRELKNIIERMVIMASDKIIGIEDLPLELKMNSDTIENKFITGIGPLKEILEKEVFALEEVEKVVIAIALQRTRWNKQETAKLLGIGRTTLYEKIRKYGLDRRAADRKREDE